MNNHVDVVVTRDKVRPQRGHSSEIAHVDQMEVGGSGPRRLDGSERPPCSVGVASDYVHAGAQLGHRNRRSQPDSRSGTSD